MIRMKKLRSSGIAGADEGYVPAGREFTAASEHRARELEEAGLAYRIQDAPKLEPLDNKLEPPPENKAAHAGPLPLAGGETGAESAPSSSAPGLPHRRRRSNRSKEGLDL